MRIFIRSVAALMVIISSLAIFDARAVTDKEMEQARTIAAQAYLRYANDGSGYLDDLKPATTMSELEKNLKTKEKENIKAFKAIATPKDYASWDKAKLVEYWSVTFFNSPGLTDKGKAARNRVKKKVGAMNVSVPAAPAAEKPAAAEPAAATPATPATENAAENAADANAGAAETQLPPAEEIISEATDTTVVAIEDLPHEKKSSSNASTWIYVVALLILVGVVIWLVIFASKTMQGEGGKNDSRNNDDLSDGSAIADDAVAYVAEDDSEQPVAVRREQRELLSAAGGRDTAAMEREIHDLRDECLRLGEENGRLTSDLADARRELEALRGRLKAANAVTSAASATGVRQRAAAEKREEVAPKQPEREIFLGRVNARGLFVRADKVPVAEKSVFVLVTQDGYTGSFRVIQSTEVVSMALDNPEYYLAGGCSAPNLNDTDEAEGIKTLQAGTAIFESGCWRVLRKSKIQYV